MKKIIKLSLATITVGLLNTFSVSALTFQNSSDVDFTLNPTINVTLSSNDLIIDNLAPGSASDSNIITVGVSTNAGYGYYLSATANTSSSSTDLTHETSNSNTFTSLSSNVSDLASIPDNHWGYSYSTDGGTNWVSGDTGSAVAGYNGLPLDGNNSGSTGVKLLNTSTYATSGSVQFKIGAKAANTQAAGTYNGTVNFYAVTNPSPTTFDDAFASAGKSKYLGYYTMQDMSANICQAVEQGFNTKLIDVRDNEIYTVAKLKDDNCWMLDNLRLGSDHPITLTSQDTNMAAESWDLPSSGDFYYSYTAAILSANNVNYIVTNYGTGSGKMGAHYNYCAASAGTFCSLEDSDMPTTPYNICPINWRLPTGGLSGEYENTYTAYNHNADNFKQALSATLSGLNAFSYVDTYGDFWTSTYYERSGYDGYMFRFSVSASDVATTNAYQRSIGLSIRCLAK